VSQKKKTKKAGRKSKPRQPPVHIPLQFEDAVKGLLALSLDDAKAVREEASEKER
jgi:hypothetical protein